MRIRIAVIVIILFVLILFAFFMVKAKYFVVRKIILPKNVSLKKDAFVKYLHLTPPKQIWLYNTQKLQRELSRLPYLKNCKVQKKYPNTLKLTFEIRKPIAFVRGKEGKIYQVDETGFVFAGLRKNKKHLPLVFYDNSKDIFIGATIKGKEYHLIEVLSSLKNNDKNIYNSISQIKVVKNNFMVDYFVNYVNDSKNIIIKSKINDEILKKGAVCSLFLLDNSAIKNLLFTEIGFIF